MPRKKHTDEKIEALRHEGSLNPHPENVTDPLFQEPRGTAQALSFPERAMTSIHQ